MWLAICVWRSPIVFEPPYWDSAMGLFAEANFLAETDFDYGRLMYEEKRFLEGGPAVYVISIMPTLVAIVMKLAPSTQAVFIIGHLFTFACAAAVAVLTFGLLYRDTGPIPAGLIALAVLTTPIFAVQIDMLGMDLPLATLGLVVAGFLTKHRYLAAGVAATLAFAVKLSGALLTVATACFFMLLLVLARWKGPVQRKRRMWIGAGVAFFLIGIQMLSSNWRSSLPTDKEGAWDFANAQGWQSLAPVLQGCPEVVVVTLLTAVLSVVSAVAWVIVRYREAKQDSQKPLGFRALQAAIAEQPLPVFTWTVVCGISIALLLVYTIPRYLILPIPLVYVTCGLLLFSQKKWRPFAGVLVAGLIVFNVANSSGRFLPAVATDGTDNEYDRRTGALLERSREYIDDHNDNLQVIDLIQREYSDRVILACNPFTYLLSLPRLGYVEQPLQGFSANPFSSEHFPTAEEILENPPRSLLVIRPKNRFLSVGPTMIPPPQDKFDEVLLELGEDKSLVVYLRRWPYDLTPEELRWQYLQWLWPAEAKLKLARQSIAAGNIAAAERELREALEISPEFVEAHHELGLLYTRQKEFAKAEHQFLEAVRIDDQRADSLYRLGMAQWRLDKQNAAIANFNRAIEAEGGSNPAQLQLARIDLHQGRWAKAVARFQHVLDASPTRNQAISATSGLARVLATATDEDVRNPAEAIRLGEEACQTTNYENSECLEALALAYQAAGRTEDERRIRALLPQALRNLGDPR